MNPRLLVAAALLLLASHGDAGYPPKQPMEKADLAKSALNSSGSTANKYLSGERDRDLYPSPAGGRPFELLIRGKRSRFGRFDADGNFIPEPWHDSMPPHGPGGGFITFRFTNHLGGPTAIGEHRSGRLILGTMVKGVFIPEIGSKVLDIHKDFNVKKPERIVYNLWETVEAIWAERKKNGLGETPIPKVDAPPPHGTPKGWELVPYSKVDSNGEDLWYIRVIGKIAEFGHLDGQGEFIPDYGLPIVSREGLLSSVRNNPSSIYPRRYYTLPLGEQKTERVYEYRSGRLIKGVLHDTGNFVPELGSTILDFKDYNRNDRRRIYNLPGMLRKVK